MTHIIKAITAAAVRIPVMLGVVAPLLAAEAMRPSTIRARRMDRQWRGPALRFIPAHVQLGRAGRLGHRIQRSLPALSA